MKKIIILIAYVALLVSCASANSIVLSPKQSEEIKLFAQKLAEKTTLSEQEKSALQKGLYQFSEFLINHFGEKKYRELLNYKPMPNQLFSILQQIYNKNSMKLIAECYKFFDNTYTPSKQEWRSESSQHFIYIYRDGSSAHNDIGIIKNEAEKSFNFVFQRLSFARERLENNLDSLAEMKDSMTGLFVVKEGNYEYTGGKIVIVFCENKKEFEEVLKRKVESGTRGETSFGFFGDSTRSGFYCRIALLYRIVLELSNLTHEIAHAVYCVTSANFSAQREWQEKIKSEKAKRKEWKLTQEEIDLYFPNMSMFLMEGVPWWSLFRIGLFADADIFPTPKQAMRELIKKDGFVRIEKIMNGDFSLNFIEIVITVLGSKRYIAREMRIFAVGSAYIIDYLLEKYSCQKLQELITTPTSKTINRFKEIYGMDLKQFEEKINADVRKTFQNTEN